MNQTPYKLRFFWLWLALGIFIISHSWTIQASEVEGTIEICLEKSSMNRSYEGVRFDAYRCAQSDGDTLTFFESYKDCTLQMDELDDATKMKEALQYLNIQIKQTQKEPFAQAIVNEEGQAVFEHLPYGLYFFCVSDPGEYELVGNFLAMLPAWNSEKNRGEDFLRIQAKAYPLPDLCIIKVDANKEPILHKDFAFSSYEDEEGLKLIETKVGDVETGIVEFRLNLGQTIYIQETKAPEGYKLSKQRIKIFMDEEGNLFVNDQKGPVEGLKVQLQCINRLEDEEEEKPSLEEETPNKPNTTQQSTPSPTSQKTSTNKPDTAVQVSLQKWLLIVFSSALIVLALYSQMKRTKKN